jgi:ABC-type dipeptide/oligopeptide/nickel transport system permease subunit
MADSTLIVSAGSAVPTTARSKRRRRAVPLSALLLLLIVAFCVLGPFFSPYGANELDSANALASPSSSHWLGTDEVGRDMATRLMYGGRLSLGIAAGAVLIALVLGTAWGMAAATGSRLLSELLMRAADITMAIPQIMFALLFVAAFGASRISLIIITGLLLSPSSARMARAAVLQEIGQDYYVAGVAYGARRRTLMLSEVLPNAAPSIAGQAVINAASAIILEASLSFVGLGIQPPGMSWGTLLQQGYGQIYSAPFYAMAPAAAILLTVLSLNLLADRSAHSELRRGAR